MSKMLKTRYKAAIYLRLSRDDGDDKAESDSISNQRAMILEYASGLDDVDVVCEMVDDGYSGSNFDRPGFSKLLEAIEQKKVNCVIVKDLSRFSRDYIGSGIYAMNLFPKWGVRLIAINDNYDSVKPMNSNDELMFSFRSVVNDIYLRDISVKIRSHLDIKRKKGEYIGAFVAYGYLKSPENKHEIIIDETVAPNIVSIFQWKIEGMSPSAIADKLNDLGILSPAEYKKYMGSKLTGFQTGKNQGLWSHVSVQRILKNEIYTGTLIQGKTTTASHKVKKLVEREKSDWAIKENSHPPIISKLMFDTANEIMMRDTRNSSKNADTYIFSGLLFCADCKNSMIRRVSKYKDSQYVYYRCGTQKTTGECSNHNIREEAIYEMVFQTLNAHIKTIIELQNVVKNMNKSELSRNNQSKIDKLIKEKEAEIKKRKQDIFYTHQSLLDGVITQEEFKDFKGIYDEQIRTAEEAILRLNEEKAKMQDNVLEMCEWMNVFTELGEVKKLTHKMLVMLIDKIYVINKNSINIVFKYQSEFEHISKILDTVENTRANMIMAG
jgi:DNA invertase Pin-like site-specific DNA recombinase